LSNKDDLQTSDKILLDQKSTFRIGVTFTDPIFEFKTTYTISKIYFEGFVKDGFSRDHRRE